MEDAALASLFPAGSGAEMLFDNTELASLLEPGAEMLSFGPSLAMELPPFTDDLLPTVDPGTLETPGSSLQPSATTVAAPAVLEAGPHTIAARRVVRPPPRASAVAAAAAAAAAVTTQPVPSEQQSSDDSDELEQEASHLLGSHDGATAPDHTKPKRRRRTRNAKQQELNRLAQQRYRQRKKQRQQDLQVTVDSLASQLEKLKARDAEIVTLRRSNDQLTATLTETRAQLDVVERKLTDQNAAMEAARRMASTSPRAGSVTSDATVLAGQLAAVLKDVLQELGIVEPAPGLLFEKLAARLGACWRDALVGGVPARAQVGAADKSAAPMVTVSCY